MVVELIQTETVVILIYISVLFESSLVLVRLNFERVLASSYLANSLLEQQTVCFNEIVCYMNALYNNLVDRFNKHLRP